MIFLCIAVVVCLGVLVCYLSEKVGKLEMELRVERKIRDGHRHFDHQDHYQNFECLQKLSDQAFRSIEALRSEIQADKLKYARETEDLQFAYLNKVLR